MKHVLNNWIYIEDTTSHFVFFLSSYKKWLFYNFKINSDFIILGIGFAVKIWSVPNINNKIWNKSWQMKRAIGSLTITNHEC